MRILTLFALVATLMWGCNGSGENADHQEEHAQEMTEGEHQHASDEWAEAEEFHTILALTYHPMEDEGKMEAVPENAEELLEKARVWAEAEVPAQFSEEDFQEALDALVMDAEKLVDLVNSDAGEEELRQQVYAIHDRFHMLEEKLSGDEHMHAE